MRPLALILLALMPLSAAAQSDRPQLPAASIQSAARHTSCAVSVPLDATGRRRVTFVIDCVSGEPLPIPGFDGLAGCRVQPELVPPEAGRRLDTSAVRLGGECALLGQAEGRIGRIEHGSMQAE